MQMIPEWDVQYVWQNRQPADLTTAQAKQTILLDTGGEALIVSQFTLYGDCWRAGGPALTKLLLSGSGRRPFYKLFVEQMKDSVSEHNRSLPGYDERDLGKQRPGNCVSGVGIS